MTSTYRGIVALSAAVVLSIAMFRWESQSFQILLLIPAIGLVGVAAMVGPTAIVSIKPETTEVVTLAAVVIGAVIFAMGYTDVVRPEGTVDWLIAVALIGSVLLLALIGALDLATHAWLGFVICSMLTLIYVIIKTGSGIVIDVQIFQTDSVAALLRGANPYTIFFDDPYSAAQSAEFYGEGVSVNGILQFGYPYYPLSLLVVAPFEILLRDFRFAHAAALVGAAMLMERMQPGILSRRAAICFLLASPATFVVRFGWIDPLMVLFVVGVVFATSREMKSSSYLVGLLMAIKQISVFLAIPSLLVVEKPWTPQVVIAHFARAGLVFLVVTLPFVLWNPRDFWDSVVALQFHQPFRPDSIAFPALFPGAFERLPSVVSLGIPMMVIAIVTVVVLMRTPQGAQGFAVGAALVLIIVFALSKQAFPNYYIVVIALLCAGAAASLSEEHPDTVVGSMTLPHDPIKG